MPKRLTLQSHLNLEELGAYYRKAKDPVERSHWQIIWLLAQGKPTQEVAATMGYSPEWIREIARRYNQLGPSGLGDRRHQNPGGDRLLSDQQLAELRQTLQGPAPDGGPWNSRKVAQWIADKTSRQIHVQRGWDYLRRLGPQQEKQSPSIKPALGQTLQWQRSARKAVPK